MCISDNEQPIARSMLIDLNSDEFHDYPFMISLDRCCYPFMIILERCCNAAEDPFGRIFAPNKIEYVNLKVFF